MPEVKQQLLVWMATGQVVHCDFGLSIVSSLDLEPIRDSQLWAGCLGIDLTARYCIDLNLQYNVDISSAAVYIRVLHLIKAKFDLYSTIMPVLFVSL